MKKKSNKIFYMVGGIIMLLVCFILNIHLATKLSIKDNSLDIEIAKYDVLKEKYDNLKTTHMLQSKDLKYLNYKSYVYEKKAPEFDKIIKAAYVEAEKYPHFSPYLVLSIIETESNFRRKAKSSFADGLMQVNTKVWSSELSIDKTRIFDVNYNIQLGLKILNHYYLKEGRDINRALFRYNSGYKYNNSRYVPKVMNIFLK